MANDIRLSGSFSPQDISNGIQLYAPGMYGTVTEMETGERATRGAGMEDALSGIMDQAASAEGMHLFGEFEIAIERDDYAGMDAAATRSAGIDAQTRSGEPAMVLSTPKTRDNMGSAVLYTDENGESHWIFAEDPAPAEQFTFMLPREGAQPMPTEEGGEQVRGIITKGLRRLVKVFAWLGDDIVGMGALFVVQKWEEAKRPYALTMAADGAPINWPSISGQRTLLLLHGTFSTSEAAFDGLRKSPSFAQLQALYGGRIIAFDHPSLHQSPADNIKEFFSRIPADVALHLDVVTHSRGGLVGRELMERHSELGGAGRSLEFGKAIFVAAPHCGTILTNREHWIALIDNYTNLLTNLPDNPATITLEAILTLVKIVGGALVGHLPGLQAMRPDGEYLERLNAATPSQAQYYALGARYAPAGGNLLERIGQLALAKAVGKIFGEDSDMVVPTLGSFGLVEQAGNFPIPAERQMCYEAEAKVNHINFFNIDAVNEQIYAWLSE